MKRPTGPLCDGCHSVNFNVQTNTVTEWNVGCERCHGPGRDHIAHRSRANIVNPGQLDYVRANDACIQCHSQGRPPTNPIDGKYYDWPVGFDVRLNLHDFWRLEEHHLGETSFTHVDAPRRRSPQPYFPLHYARHDGELQDSESVQFVP
jgi:Cytochrome c3